MATTGIWNVATLVLSVVSGVVDVVTQSTAMSFLPPASASTSHSRQIRQGHEPTQLGRYSSRQSQVDALVIDADAGL